MNNPQSETTAEQSPVSNRNERGQPSFMSKFTPEEISVLKECQKEAFWYRSIPVSLGLMGLVELAATRSVRPNPRQGIILKHIGSWCLGFFLGRFMYAEKCKEKILQLPNSPLADALRKEGSKHKNQDDMSMPYSQTEQYQGMDDSTSLPQKIILRDEFQSQQLDTESNIAHKGLDDAHKPSLDKEADLKHRDTGSQSQSYISYEDLRQRNRDEYQRAASASNQPPPSPSPRSSEGTGSKQASTTSGGYMWDRTPNRTEVRRNQYGDIIEE